MTFPYVIITVIVLILLIILLVVLWVDMKPYLIQTLEFTPKPNKTSSINLYTSIITQVSDNSFILWLFIATVQFNSNLTLTCVSLAETWLISKSVHKQVVSVTHVWQSMADDTREECQITRVESTVFVNNKLRVALWVTYRLLSKSLGTGFLSSQMTQFMHVFLHI